MKNSSLSILKQRLKWVTAVSLTLVTMVLSSSCGNVKKLRYLQGKIDTARVSKVEIPEPIVQKGDLLSITVYSDDPLATAAVTNPVYNVAPSMSAVSADASGSGAAGAGPQGFLVSNSGDLHVYKLGTIHVEGTTKKQIADTLTSLYSSLGLLKNPYVDVRFISYKISLIGEVGRPGQYSIPSDRINIFEALGLAGDITVFGRKDNVLVIREINGERKFARLNLKKTDVFLSPYYYLQQNDMVVVDVSKGKAIANDQVGIRTLSVASTLLSVVAIFFTIFRTN